MIIHYSIDIHNLIMSVYVLSTCMYDKFMISMSFQEAPRVLEMGVWQMKIVWAKKSNYIVFGYYCDFHFNCSKVNILDKGSL